MDANGSYGPAAPGGTLARVKIGITVRLQDTEGEDLGFAQVPAPVEQGDVLALADGSTWRVVMLIDLLGLEESQLFELGDVVRVVDVLCMVEPAPFGPVS